MLDHLYSHRFRKASAAFVMACHCGFSDLAREAWLDVQAS